jgi:hypothetical protein
MHIATMETVLPDAPDFVLHGTLLVPPGTWPNQTWTPPLAVQDYDGTLLETQLEVVSRFSSSEAGADVVEVLARVRRDPKRKPGERAQYRIVVSTKSTGATPPSSPNGAANQVLLAGRVPLETAAAELLGVASAINLTARDASGTTFQLAPLALPVLDTPRTGAVVHEVQTYGVMRSDAGSAARDLAPLPNLFGVHSFARVLAGEPILLLDLRLNNGASGATSDSAPLGEVYFRSLTLHVPAGYVVLQDGVDPGTRGNGTDVFDLVAPIPSAEDGPSESLGRMHYMPTQGQMQRRLAIVAKGNEASARRALDQAGLAFCVAGDGLLSWFSSSWTGYFPQGQQLPRLDYYGLGKVRSELAADFQALRGNLTSGMGRGHYPLESDRLGWAHPYGVAYGGMTGGAEIHLLEGVEIASSASQSGYRHLLDIHRMQTDRMPVALYNEDGKPSALRDWVRHASDPQVGKYMPFSYYNGSMPGRDKRNRDDAFGYSKAPREQLEFVRARGLQPDYEDALRAFDPHDSQHLIRYTRTAKALAWLGNDSLAKGDLLQAAENFQLEYHGLPNGSSGQVQGTGFLAAKREVDSRPGLGFAIGRGQGWGLDAATAAYALSRDDTWRQEARSDWLGPIVDTIAKGQSACNGFIQSKTTGRWLEGKYRVRQSIEQAILESALEGLRLRVFANVDTKRGAGIHSILVASYTSMISDMAWPQGSGAPWSHLAVGSADGNVTFCDASELPDDGHDQYTDGYLIGQSLARGFDLTGDERFLEKAREFARGESLLEGLQSNGLKNIANRAALLELAQRE